MIINRHSAFLPEKLDDFDQEIIDMLAREPLENMFNLNIYEIIETSSKIDFNASRYNRRPDLVAWDHYNSLSMTNLILLVNNCVSLFNFTRELVGDKILLPDTVYLKKLLNSNIT